VLEQLFYGQLDIAQDRAKKARAKSLARMNWNGRDSAIVVPQENVAATSPNDLETDPPQDSHDLLAL
jgi:hypothetical protein